MNTILFALFAAFALLTSPNLASAGPVVVTVAPQVLFAPTGFDSNDNAQLVLFGEFHDVCHRLAPSDFLIDHKTQKIYVTQQAYTSHLCAQIWVDLPYSVTLNLGALAEGQYQIYLKDLKGQYKFSNSVSIEKARMSGSPDDYTYAQIDDAEVVRTADPKVVELTLKGTINNTCLSLDEVKINFTKGNVYDVLPILSRSNGHCETTSISFVKTVTINQVPSEPSLLNIRSMGGQSIEKVLYNLPHVNGLNP